jgi:hypothetical protein
MVGLLGLKFIFEIIKKYFVFQSKFLFLAFQNFMSAFFRNVTTKLLYFILNS